MNNIKRNVQQGFTLIELMIVIAIVAILVALAVPAYQDYIVRAKFGECVNGAAPGKLAIAEFRMTDGTNWPNDTESGFVSGVTGVSTECEAYTYDSSSGALTVNGNIIALGISGILGAVLTPNLQSELSDGNINWVCTNGGTTITDAGSIKYLPSTCRGG